MYLCYNNVHSSCRYSFLFSIGQVVGILSAVWTDEMPVTKLFDCQHAMQYVREMYAIWKSKISSILGLCALVDGI